MSVRARGDGYLGSAVCEALRANGWRAIPLGRNVTENESGYRCDLTIEADVIRAVAKITDTYGPIDACIHGAVAEIDNRSLLNLSADAFDMQMDVAVRGAFLLAKAAVPHMREESAFIGITTKLLDSGTVLSPMGAYIPAKYALHGFLRTLAAETKQNGIRVYAVAPGFLPGGLNKNMPAPVIDMFAAKTGVGTASLEDTAKLIGDLCTNADALPSGSSISISPIKCSQL